MKRQLKKTWVFQLTGTEEISTCSPEDYYKHQQKFFLDLYDKGLVYRKEELRKLGPN